MVVVTGFPEGEKRGGSRSRSSSSKARQTQSLRIPRKDARVRCAASAASLEKYPSVLCNDIIIPLPIGIPGPITTHQNDRPQGGGGGGLPGTGR